MVTRQQPVQKLFPRICNILNDADRSHRENHMPKYLLQANYVGDGVKGLLKDGGTKRRDIAAKAIKSLGGTLEAFYFAFGDADAYLICDVPDHASMTAISLTVGASGTVTIKTIVLITPEEVDAAAKKTPIYQPPGQ